MANRVNKEYASSDPYRFAMEQETSNIAEGAIMDRCRVCKQKYAANWDD